MLRRDAETPAVLGHKAGRTRFCSRPSGTRVIPSGPPHTFSFSRPGSLLARLLFQLHLRLSRPLLSPSRGDRRGRHRLPLPRLSPIPYRNIASLRLRILFSEDGAAHSWELRAAAGGAGALGSIPAENRARTATTGFKGRRGCGGSGASPAGTGPSV